MGGAIFNMGDVAVPGCGFLTMIDCTLAFNIAQGGNGGFGGNDGATGGAGGSGYGGAIFNLDGLVVLGESTVDRNVVAGGQGGVSGGNDFAKAPNGAAGGGAVYNLAFGNFLSTGGTTSADLGLFNSILADSTGSADLVSLAVNGNGINRARVTGTTNLVQSYVPIIGNPIPPGVITIKGVSPQLGPLKYNGGPTPTMAVGVFTPPFGKGNPNVGGLPLTDQRLLKRVVDGRLDLGAYEVQNWDAIFEEPSSGGPLIAKHLDQAAVAPTPHGPWHVLAQAEHRASHLFARVDAAADQALVDALMPPTGAGIAGQGMPSPAGSTSHLPGRTPLDAVRLKRGVVDDGSLASWLDSIRHGRAAVVAASNRMVDVEAFLSTELADLFAPARLGF
jgi:hypothetical protein